VSGGTRVDASKQIDAAIAAFLELPVGVGVVDQDLRFVAVNDALAAMNGLRPDEHVGRIAPDLLPDLDPSVWEVLRGVIATGAPMTHIVRGITPASGDEGAWLEEFHPWRDRATDEILGVVTTVIDVTDHERVQRAAERRHEQLAGLAVLATELVGVADQADVAAILCRHATTLLRATAAAVAIGRSDGPVDVIASFGYPDALGEAADWLAEGTALADTARTGVAHEFTTGVDWDRQFSHGAEHHRRLGLASTMTTPLLSEDETLGAMSVSHTSSRPFSDDDRATLATLASIGSQAMERARAWSERARATRLREAFIDVMAHELKTPLATIYGGLQTIATRGDRLPPSAREELLADATAEAHRLVRLVDDLVVLSRLERGVEVDLSEPLMLSHITRAVVTAKVQYTRVPIEVTVSQGVPPVRGEGPYVEQVLRNLVTNALKYGRPPYEVSVTATDNEVRVRVLDRGPGVPPDPERLFDLYYRDPSAAKRAGGSGIGLFVCRELVGLMGGRTWVANRPEGGAEFGFALPVWRDDESEA
jgi:PAS domain S-box-containing protein